MEEDINFEAFEAASDLFSSTEISEVCGELELRTLEDRETDRILAYIHPESDILYPTDLEEKVIDPLTGQKLSLTDAFPLSDPKACITSDESTSSAIPRSMSIIRDPDLDEPPPADRIDRVGQAKLKADPREISKLLSKSPPGQQSPLAKAAAAGNSDGDGDDDEIDEIDDIIDLADGSETRQIFIFRSGKQPTDKPILEIEDLEIPINEAGKPVYGDIYNDVDSDELQEQGGVVIPDNQISDVQNGKFELDSESVSELLNDIGLSSEFISNLQQGNFNIGSELPEINLSGYQLGHIASGFVIEDFPNYLNDLDLDGLGVYPLSSLSVLKNISENLEF
ncbi:MAG: hypothetical protein QNJ53_24635 [Pleurocapsa sp. MO_192.B19]|nr:hypothetical protein [Pleurocapsa sp. MO_192.B19]